MTKMFLREIIEETNLPMYKPNCKSIDFWIDASLDFLLHRGISSSEFNCSVVCSVNGVGYRRDIRLLDRLLIYRSKTRTIWNIVNRVSDFVEHGYGGKRCPEGCKSRLDTFTWEPSVLSWERGTSWLPTLLYYLLFYLATDDWGTELHLLKEPGGITPSFPPPVVKRLRFVALGHTEMRATWKLISSATASRD